MWWASWKCFPLLPLPVPDSERPVSLLALIARDMAAKLGQQQVRKTVVRWRPLCKIDHKHKTPLVTESMPGGQYHYFREPAPNGVHMSSAAADHFLLCKTSLPTPGDCGCFEEP